MGSLMAGWDSPVLDPETVRFQRNKSETKEEIEAYWRSMKKDEEEATSETLTENSEESILKEPERKIQRSSSVPSSKEGLLDVGTETSLEKLIKKNGWWTRSNSAFLNEPPVLASDRDYKYASQFHVGVAGIATPKAHDGTAAL